MRVRAPSPALPIPAESEERVQGPESKVQSREKVGSPEVKRRYSALGTPAFRRPWTLDFGTLDIENSDFRLTLAYGLLIFGPLGLLNSGGASSGRADLFSNQQPAEVSFVFASRGAGTGFFHAQGTGWRSSVVEHLLGKEEVMGSSPIASSPRGRATKGMNRTRHKIWRDARHG